MRTLLQQAYKYIAVAILALLVCTGSTAQSITKVEYFIDNDPGRGAGTVVSVTPGTDVTASFQVSINAFPAGFHRLYTRGYIPPYTVTENGQPVTKGGWSHTNVRTFYKEDFTTINNPLSNVVAGEYFLDTDPGFGKGSGIPLTPGLNVSNVAFAFDVSSLGQGFHRLYVRFKNQDGTWSHTNTRTFYKENLNTSSGSVPNVVAGEYFIDNDPGFGAGTPISFAQGTDVSTISFNADISSLPAGFHRLYTRFKDANGRWALTNNRTFYKDALLTGSGTPANVVKLEYFVDTDPGFGKGTNVPVTPGADLNNISFALNMDNVSVGNHTLYVRAIDDKGAWSLTNLGTFKVEPPTDLIITVGNITGTLCAGSPVAVPFSTNAPFGTNNIFTAQLSDPNGSFANPTNIGTLTAREGDTIDATIPAHFGAGINYRIRVIASSPNDTSGANATALRIQRAPASFWITGVNTTCIGNQAYTVANLNVSEYKYEWSINHGGTIDTSGHNNTIHWTEGGSHTISLKVTNDCGSQTVTLNVFVYTRVPQTKPVLTISGRNLSIPAYVPTDSANGYQWYKDGAAIPGAVGSTYTAVGDGSFTAAYTNTCGAGQQSNAAVFAGERQNQIITFPPVPDQVFGADVIKLLATSSAGLAITYNIVSGPGQIKNDTLVILGAGTIVIKAFQAGNEQYNEATVNINVIVNPIAATITLSNLTQVFNGGGKQPTATTVPAGLPVSFTYNGVATAPVNAGTYEVIAKVSHANYSGADTATFIIQKASQSINLGTTPDKAVGAEPFKLLVNATSGLPVALSISSTPVGIATLSTDTVTIIGAGTVVIKANQAGNANYNTAAEVTDTFLVVQSPDLAVQNVTSPVSSVAPNDVVTLNWSVHNVGTGNAAGDWSERIYMQSPAGQHRTLITTVNYSNGAALIPGSATNRSATVTIPAIFDIGDQGVFVVELLPGTSVKEAPGTTANNTGVQATAWSTSKLLTVELSSPQITEGGAVVNGAVKRTGSLAAALTVNLSVSNPGRITIPASVTIPANQSGATFTVTVPDNATIDGVLSDSVIAAATGYGQGKVKFQVLDNDQPTLTITNLPVDVMEGGAATFRINTNLTPATALTVFLTSSSNARFPVPASVTIPAGALFVDVPVTLASDAIPEIAIDVTINAGAANHNPAIGTITVKDDDVPGLELVFETNLVSEGAGAFATKATLRRAANSPNAAFSVNLGANLPNTLIMPATLSLAAGENEKTFTVGVIDNSLADGQRTVTITASVFVNSCGCSAPPATAGYVSANLSISDNDGQAITITAPVLTLPEGLSNAGTVRITRNSATTGGLIVNLTSSNVNEATVPPSVVIPAGAAYVDVPITTINDNLADGNQQVYIQATANGFATGTIWVIVSDRNKPDLQVPLVKLNNTTIQAMSVFNYQLTVTNTGFSTAPAGAKVRGYLSKDGVYDLADSLISEDVLNTSIPAGQSAQITNAVQMPNLPGNYNLIYEVNPDLDMEELLTTNNTSNPLAVFINPDYTVTANVAAAWFLKGAGITITGVATKTNGSPAANSKVEVYVITNGLRRELTATTDASGNYSVQFVPLAAEAGHYIVGASYPGLKLTAEQDNFDIIGVLVNNGVPPQFKVTLNEQITGTFPVQNLSAKSLAQFTLKPVTLPSGATMTFDTVAVLAGNATIQLGYKIKGTVLTNGNYYELANLNAVATEGTIQPVNLVYFCQAQQAYIVGDVNKLDVTVAQATGERVATLMVINRGAGNTGNITVALPQVNWLSSVTPLTLPGITTGDTTLVVLKFRALDEVPFNYPINGSIVVKATNGNTLNVPFTFEKKSTSTGAVKVGVTNQFTYYSEGAPKVADAQVVIKNYFTGEIYAQGNTDATGFFNASNLPQGKHRITVNKEKHLPYEGTITVNAGETTSASVFINYQAITFSWTVVPTGIQDQYDVTLTTKFETHVPMPVVTIDMPKDMPQLSGTETYAFNVTLTNHGLIAAENVELHLPEGDVEYEFITNYQTANLAAQSSIQVPVIMKRRGTPLAGGRMGMSLKSLANQLGMDARTANGGTCQDFTFVLYMYKCEISTGLWQKIGTLINYTGRTCSSGPQGGGELGVGGGSLPYGGNGLYFNIPCSFCELPGAGPGGNTPAYTEEKKSCVQCINDMIAAAFSCGVPGGSIGGPLTCIIDTKYENGNWLDYLKCFLPDPTPPPIACAQAIAKAISTCLSTGVGSRKANNARGEAAEIPAVFVQIRDDIDLVTKAYALRDKWSVEYMGDILKTDAWRDIKPMIGTYISNVDSIRADKQAAVLAAMQGYDIQPAVLQAFFTRWNTSVYARSQGVYLPNATYPNIINWTNVKTWSDSIGYYHNIAIDRGYHSIDDMYINVRKDLDVALDVNGKQAVCASVTVQFSQKLTMTREAFEGTLDIFNGHPTDKMDSLSVVLQVTDENGVPSNGLFEIQTKSLSNLANVTGTGAINAQQRGMVKFLFIPEIGAAPTAPKVYNFAGYVRYWDPYAKAMVNMPLSKVPLTVNPSPNLMLHYFMQRNIMGDDPLTSPAIEPTEPAELAVMVENHGYGPAVNMMISSAQPKIIENEKGLAVNFNLIGSNLQGQPKNLGVTDINFGTVPALTSRIGQWYFTSSLLGKFVSYEASVVHANSFGNPDLSLVKGIKLHELTKSIKAYGTLDDGITDFLVNDLFDVNDEPDIIYFSQGQKTAKVSPATSGAFTGTLTAPNFTNTLTVTPSVIGWNYIKLNDPGNRLWELESVTRSDGQVIPLNNAWLTFVTLPVSNPPVYENKFHFVDTFAAPGAVTYTVKWKAKSTVIPEIVSINGAPTQVSPLQVKELVVVFNKAIDAATFTKEDMTLTFQGGANLINSSVVITQLDTASFKVDLSALTTGNGFYNFTVQSAEVADLYGTKGQTGKNVTWSQFLNVPMVEAFKAIPDSRMAASFDTIHVQFNLPIDETTATPAKFIITKDGVQQPGSVVIDSIRADKKVFYLSGLGHIMTTPGAYVFTVDLPNIKSTTQVAGVATQSVTLTVDNAGPTLVKLEKSTAGGLDAQHVPNVTIAFNENVIGFNIGALTLKYNGALQPLNIAQLSNTDLQHWTAGSFGTVTYPDGDYEFTIDMTQVRDALGNAGTGTQTITWTVNRAALITIANLAVTPDAGYSNTDLITSGQSMQVKFNLSADAAEVKVSQTDLGGESVLTTLTNLTAGNQSVPVTLITGGNTGIRVLATGANGGVDTADLQLFVDQVPLTAAWQLKNDTSMARQADTISIKFATKLLSSTGLDTAVYLTRNGVALPTTGVFIHPQNDTMYYVGGLRTAGIAPGAYRLTFNATPFSKYSSGKSGDGLVTVNWTVLSTNRAPVANAGTDVSVTAPTTVVLDGSASSDPDADAITYSWVAPEGITLNDSTLAKPSFVVTAANQNKSYDLLLVVSDGNLIHTDVVRISVSAVTTGLIVQAKALLQGPFVAASGLMQDSLRSKSLVPATDPYPALGFGTPGAPAASISPIHLTTTGDTAIVDWIWLELRNSGNPAQVVAARSALLRRNGSIVDLNNWSPVTFANVADGSYYLVVRHRNHLGVMTAAPVTLNSTTPTAIDFTAPATAVWGTDARNNQGGVMTLWSGDANGDGTVSYNGGSNDKNAVLSQVGLTTSNNVLIIYHRTDVNMDGSVKYNGAGNDKNVVLGVVGLPTPNRIVTQQLP
ncbi:MBG domain-containing protein [Paraflavitalea sp. CAU 1676]|uniref:MBG domain-containing protein n=1 Tax=Paraflavitalea sp. CAU 1676 TaxID=3032598 RepID=UPI0023DAB8B7|nr:MBG domain-containing protein [Paraflavitalea sp. CAU 1676]MDF2188548.1 MBG domain-containing protein [Paraflavitalea sp. CAU 1676]